MVTGLSFDLPQARWMDQIQRLRVRHDPARLKFPIEITVVGSSGQRRLANCGLRFEPSPYDYVPHCTIAILPADAAAAVHAEVRACPVPLHNIEVSSVSFWSVDHSLQIARQGERIALGA
jgi:hypothetical protein